MNGLKTVRVFKFNKKCSLYFSGRRICPGEQLSMKAMYLLLVKLVQTFTIDFPDGEPGPGLKPQRVYGCRMASEFKVSLLPR